ncbi:hypothetical protein F5888DRAFT_1885779 [Russula emetica]|nr:hypothetical protein F5888DRAFT_1885779 [Russula emetica]
MFVYENQNQSQSQSPSESFPLLSPSLSGVTGSIILGGKPSRPRHRMSTDKLETLDAFFKFNTHPSRKEKEAISKDLDMDLKTVTIWFQNKRQTLARSRRQLSSEGATTPTAAIDILAHASATMSPLVATEKTSASLASVPVQPGSVAQGSYPGCLSLNQSTSRPQRASSCDSIPKTHSQALTQPRVALSSVTHNAHVFVFESVRTEMPSSSCVSSPFLDLRKPRLGGGRTIHPEDLWKHIPSSPAQPALSSPDVSPDIGTPSRSSRFTVQRPRTLEWACARSAKRRRTNPDTVYQEDGETDSECNPIVDTGICHSSFSISEARVPLECYDKYPLDVVHGAILLLGLRDAAVDLEL